MDAFWVERVLLAVDQIPAGRVSTYGDLARLAGTGPRQVGAIMAASGGEVAWWRVVNASGALPPHLVAEAFAHWDAEGIAHRDGRVRLRAHRVDAAALASAFYAAQPGQRANRGLSGRPDGTD